MAKESWGKWGKEDERGALNHIGEAQVKRAVSLVKSGEILALAQPISDKLPMPTGRPVMHLMIRDGGDYAAGAKPWNGFQFAEDMLITPAHMGTHVDALCHAWYDDELYNGFSSDSMRSTMGAAHCDAQKLTPVLTRGVLLDIVQQRGSPLDKGEVVTVADLQAAAKAVDVRLEAGDVVLIRTGWLETQGNDTRSYFAAEPGIDVAAALWLAEQNVAVVGADNYGVEAIPFAQGTTFPVHQRLIRDYGIPLLEGVVLKQLAQKNVGTFMFSMAALPIVGGTGSPVCPVAVL